MSTVKPLTPKQRKVLQKIRNFLIHKDYPPSLKEIAMLISSSDEPVALSTAQYYVDELIKKGYLNRDANVERGLSLKKSKNVQIPKLGVIAAGEPIDPIEDPEPIDIPSSIKLKPYYQYYALDVKGDSMIDMGVLDGDTIIVRHQMTANNGDIVVAITEAGATLKEYINQDGLVKLVPKNSRYEPIIPQHLEIRGILEGLIRS